MFLRHVYMDEADGDNSGSGGGGDDGGEPEKLSLTQDELNKMMADNRKKLTKQNEQLLADLNKLKQTASMTTQEKEELETRITQMENQFLSKEELIKRENSKQQKQFEAELTTAKENSQFWQNNYSQATIARSLQDAAISNHAISPEQIVSMLAGRTVIKETEEGSKQYHPVVSFDDVSEDGKPITLELSPADAVKRMVELTDKYGNLFKGSAASGLGSTSGVRGDKAPKLESLKDTASYMKWRKENPHADPMEMSR
jgi:hypothetical protein